MPKYFGPPFTFLVFFGPDIMLNVLLQYLRLVFVQMSFNLMLGEDRRDVIMNVSALIHMLSAAI